MYLESKVRNFTYYFFSIIQICIIAAVISTRQLDFLRDVVFITLLASIYIYLEIKYSISVSNYIRGLIITVILVHEVGGKIFDLYVRLAVFDKLLHVFGIYSLVLFTYAIMRQFMKISFKSRFNEFIFLTLTGISLGAFFEMLEFIIDMTLKPQPPNQAGHADTNLDLIANFAGALIASFHVTVTPLMRLGRK